MLQTDKRSILSILQISQLHVEQIIAVAHRILEKKLLPNELRVTPNSIIGLIFEQPSHRTKNSFSSAAISLGANILDLSESFRDSCLRGESLSDFCRTAECYVNCLVVRSSNSSLITEINEIVQIPVINAGNGWSEHPTQALADFSVIRNNFGNLERLKITMIGCLRTSRCANSLALLLAPFQPRILMICPKELALSKEYQSIAEKRGAVFQHSVSLSDALDDDVLYFTGGKLVDDFSNISEYERYHQWFNFPSGFLNNLSPHAIVLHPLPRGLELPSEVDNDIRIRIFDQVRHALAVRKVILATLLGGNMQS
jgi:aspartate carbamoyltransferase